MIARATDFLVRSQASSKTFLRVCSLIPALAAALATPIRSISSAASGFISLQATVFVSFLRQDMHGVVSRPLEKYQYSSVVGSAVGRL